MKYSKGDIVVVLKGHLSNHAVKGCLATIKNQDTSHIPYEVDGHPEFNYGSWCVDVRPATVEEIAAYHAGIRNIADIKQEITNQYEIF